MAKTLPIDELRPLGPARSRSAHTLRELAFCALLMGSSALFTRFLSLQIPVGGIPALRFGLGSLPILMAGLMMGAARGALVGAGADLLGMLLFPAGPYLPVFTLTSALKGAMPAWIASALRGRSTPRTAVAVAVVVSQIVVTAGLGSWFLARAFGLPLWPLVVSRGISVLVTLPLFVVLLGRIVERMGGRLSRG